MKRTFNGSMGIQVIALAGGLAVACSTYAQERPNTKEDADPLLEEVVISGTRIERSGFTAPTPTTSVGAEDFELRAATNVSSVLFTLPSIRPTVTSAVSATTGLTAINLRNLGNNRTLVMADSRRIVGSTIDGVVDSNVIPSALVERVEVVTGGASAAWGSDAVAGVVNFIFKKKIEGFQGNVQYGESEQGDAKTTAASLAWGTSYAADRGQFMIATEYSNTRDQPKMDDRDWSKSHWGFITGNGITSQSATGVTVSNLAPGGVITGTNGLGRPTQTALQNIQFGPGGTIQRFEYGTSFSSPFMVGGSGDYYLDEVSAAPDVKRDSIYLRTNYEFSDQLQGFAEASLFESTGSIKFLPIYVPNVDNLPITIQRDNGYLQTLPGLATLRTFFTNNPTVNSFNVSRTMRELGLTTFNTQVKTTRYVVGLNGDLGNSYKWQTYFQKGKTRIDTKTNNLLNSANFAASMDTIVGPGGQPVCRGTTSATPATAVSRVAAPGCVPGNPFGEGSITQDVKNYVLGAASNYYDLVQDTAGLQLQGDVFSTWAGKVSLAGGMEYRKESIEGNSDPLSQQRRPDGRLGLWQFGAAQPLSGAYTVKELFAETIVPLAHELPFAETLDLNAAVRNTDYSTAGKVTTSKLGLTYTPIHQLLLRGTVSKDIRAPNLNELFQTAAGQSFNATDPGVLVNGQPSTYTTSQIAVGNTNLKPEKADTKTFGLAWTPDYISGFKASVDYYEIDIKDAIASVTAQQLVNGCFGVLGFAPTPAFCSQISRDSNGSISQVRTSPVNFQSIYTKGIDYEIAYRLPMNVIGGNLTLRALATNIRSFITNTGTSSIDRVGEIIGIGSRTPTGSPRWRGSLTSIWQKDDWTVFLESRYLGGGKYDVAARPSDIDNNNVPAVIYLSTTISYDLLKGDRTHLQVFGRVNNLLDRDPPILLTTNQNSMPTNVGLYDAIGRAYTLGVRFGF